MQRRWIACFYAAYFAFVGLYSPFLGPYLKLEGHSLDLIALALGLMQVMRIFGPFLWGWVADHSANRVVWIRLGAVGGLVFSALAFAGVGQALWLIAMLIILNFFISGLVPLSDSHAMDCCEGSAGLYGRMRLFGSLGFIASVVLFGQFAQAFGLHSYPLWAVATLVLAVLAAWHFTEPVHHHAFVEGQPSAGVQSWSESLQHLMGSARMRLFWLGGFFMIFAHGVFYAFLSLYLLKFNYGESSIGLLWGFGVFCEVLFFALQSHVFHRLKLVTWLCISFGACAVRFWLVALYPELWWVMALSQSLHCLTFAAHHTACVAWLRHELPRALWVRGQALYATIAYGLGGTAGTFAGRWVWSSFSPQWAFGMAGFAGLVALLIGLRLRQLMYKSS